MKRIFNTGLMLLLLAALFAAGCTPRNGTITLLLDDRYGLEVGDPVVYRDVTIGQVLSIAIAREASTDTRVAVVLLIDGGHFDVLYHEMAFIVQRERMLYAHKMIELRDRNVLARTPILNGDHVHGQARVDLFLDSMEGVATDMQPLHDELRERVDEGWKALKERTAAALSDSSAASWSHRLRLLLDNGIHATHGDPRAGP